MSQESKEDKTNRILGKLKTKYPDAQSFDLDGRGLHFVCEVEPTQAHPEFKSRLGNPNPMFFGFVRACSERVTCYQIPAEQPQQAMK